MQNIYLIHVKSKPHFNSNPHKVRSKYMGFLSNCNDNDQSVLVICCCSAFCQSAIYNDAEKLYVGSFASSVSRTYDLTTMHTLYHLTELIIRDLLPSLRKNMTFPCQTKMSFPIGTYF